MASRRRSFAAGVAVVAALVLSACASDHGHVYPFVGPRSSPWLVATPPPASTATSLRPPGGVRFLELGVNGSAAWGLTSTTLRVSVDAGLHWADVALAAGVTPSEVDTIWVAAGGEAWIAIAHATTIELYRRRPGPGGWVRHVLPTSPDGFDEGGQPPGVSITHGPGPLVSVTAGWSLGNATAYVLLFLSADDGTTFIEHKVSIGLRMGAPVFVDQQHGVVVAGPAMSSLYRTGDGGASWSTVSFPTPPKSQTVTFGTPAVVGSDLEVPVTLTAVDGAQTMSLYRSTDGGASFAAIDQPPLDIPAADGGYASASILGNVIWQPAGGYRIYESADGGRIWTTVRTSVSSYPLGLMSSRQAIGVAAVGGCRDSKTGCFSYQYLVRTADAGHTWQYTF